MRRAISSCLPPSAFKTPRPAGFDDRHGEWERIFADENPRAILVFSDMDRHLLLRPVREYLAAVLILHGVARHNELFRIRAEQAAVSSASAAVSNACAAASGVWNVVGPLGDGTAARAVPRNSATIR